MKNNIVWEILGWYGTVAIVGAYFLNSFNIIAANDFWYQFLNASGAIGIVPINYIKKDYQPFVLNIIWAVIGAVALVRLFV